MQRMSLLTNYITGSNRKVHSPLFSFGGLIRARDSKMMYVSFAPLRGSDLTNRTTSRIFNNSMRYARLLQVFAVIVALSSIPLTPVSAEPLIPGPKDRCLVCGMFVAKYPEWVATMVFRDGTRVYFDGPKDMFRCYFDLPKYKKTMTASDVANLYVTEYYTTRQVQAREAYFVLGSDVLGPMGHELVPVRGKKEAEAFARDHKGGKILMFDQVTASVITGIP
jgi:copper chaperone NosL